MTSYLSILRLVWPLALGMVNNAVMQFVDRAFLARFSMEALEAVLPASVLACVFLTFFQSVVGYAGVFTAQYHGAGDERMAKRSYHAGLVIALGAGLVVLGLVPACDWVFVKTLDDPEVASLGVVYLDIVMAGGVFLFGQMAAQSYFTGRGRTRVVFWVNLLGNLLNIALDPFLIFGFDFPLFGIRFSLAPHGIAGAAYATVFSQAMQCLALVLLARRETRRAVGAAQGVRLSSLVLRMLRFGIPAGGYEILNMVSFSVFVFMTERLGSVAFAASNACFTVNYLLFAPMIGFSLGAQTLVGQHLGRNDFEGASVALRRMLLLGLVFVALACAVVLALNGPILELFAPADAARHDAFVSLGFRLLCLMATWLLFDSTDVILSGALKGAGDTRFVFWLTLICTFGLWLPLVFVVLRLGGGMPELWSTMIVYVIIVSFVLLVRWLRGGWRKFSIILK